MPEHGRDEAAFATKFLHRTKMDALLLVAIVKCLDLFSRAPPTGHSFQMRYKQGHSMDKSDSDGRP